MLQGILDRLAAGDESSRDELIRHAWNRLRRLTRIISNDFPKVRRWEQTEDILQNAAVRLWKTLEKAELKDTRHFLRLSAKTIRCELIDLFRHYYGPLGTGARHHTRSGNEGENSHTTDFWDKHAADQRDPSQQTQAFELHALIEQLPEEEKEVFDLLWYHDLKQEEAASVIGIDVRTVKRRWRRAKLALQKTIHDEQSEPQATP